MNHHESVIIYKSRADQAMDELCWEHPEVGLVIGALLLVGIGIVGLVDYIQTRRARARRRGWRG